MAAVRDDLHRSDTVFKMGEECVTARARDDLIVLRNNKKGRGVNEWGVAPRLEGVSQQPFHREQRHPVDADLQQAIVGRY